MSELRFGDPEEQDSANLLTLLNTLEMFTRDDECLTLGA
jgi:hypothetical protein